MFIKANGITYTLHPHADKRMYERDITESMVKKAIEEGTPEESETSGEIVFLHYATGIGVVIDVEQDLIVTVFNLE
jgi:hypothetical protein